MIKRVILLLVLINLSLSLYGPNSNVIKLTTANFQREVVNSPDLWLVEFFAPWCGHCKNLAPEWEKAANMLKGIVKVGAINMDEEQSLGAPYGIKGFPTIKLFATNKSKPIDYQGERSAAAIANYMSTQIQKLINKRISGGGRASGPSPSPSPSPKASNNEKKQKPKTYTDKDVIVLNDSNFDSVLMNSKDMWLVEFYAPWCGHCRNLEPHWNQVATEMKGKKIKIAKFDADANKSVAGRMQISGFPTIKLFPPGSKSTNTETYEGARDAASIIQFASERMDRFGISTSVDQLLTQQQLDETCVERTNVCIIAFLPNIYDSNANERNRYIQSLTDAAKSTRGNPISVMWAQGGDFYEFEEKLQLSFGYPAVIAVNYGKQKYSIFRMAFSQDNVENYIKNLLIGRESLNDLPKVLPKLKKATEWDGKDYVPEKEDF